MVCRVGITLEVAKLAELGTPLGAADLGAVSWSCELGRVWLLSWSCGFWVAELGLPVALLVLRDLALPLAES